MSRKKGQERRGREERGKEEKNLTYLLFTWSYKVFLSSFSQISTGLLLLKLESPWEW
jgi:hypothetical protein